MSFKPSELPVSEKLVSTMTDISIYMTSASQENKTNIAFTMVGKVPLVPQGTLIFSIL
jgi:hypothetical protein